MTSAANRRLSGPVGAEPLLARRSPFDRLTANAREALVASAERIQVAAGVAVIQEGEHDATVYVVLEGRLEVTAATTAGDVLLARLGPGDLFGEAALLTGRPRNAAVTALEPGLLLALPGDAVEASFETAPAFQRALEELRTSRSARGAILRVPFLAEALERSGAEAGESLLASGRVRSLSPGETILREGEPGDSLVIVQAGFVRVTKQLEGREQVVGYHGPGSFFGEAAVLERAPRSATATAYTAVEVLELNGSAIRGLAEGEPSVAEALDRAGRQWQDVNRQLEGHPEAAQAVERLFETGALVAERLLVIDGDRCIHCDRCVDACRNRHGERRLRREGPAVAHLTLPVACRLCPDPVCLLCPYDGIRRGSDGEVYITDKCVGCTACVYRCPYDVIAMRSSEPVEPEGVLWRLLRRGEATGRRLAVAARMTLGSGTDARTPTQSQGHVETEPARWERRGRSTPGDDKSRTRSPGRAGGPPPAPAMRESPSAVPTPVDRAVKCDSCREWPDEACVAACPVAAALWVDPRALFGANPLEALLPRPEAP